MAFRTAAPSELAQWWGDFTLAAFLDCSNCCERIEHRMAGYRVIASGMPTQVINLVMDAYGGSRLARVHGAVAHLVHGAHGLIAGCSFAKDVLRSFLLPVARRVHMEKFRDYEGGITLQIEAASLGRPRVPCLTSCAVTTCI